MRKMAGVIALFWLLVSCTVTKNTWVKPGAGMAEASAALKACADQTGLAFESKALNGKPLVTSSDSTYKGSSFDKCMEGKGYHK